MPPVGINARYDVKTQGDETVVQVRLENPADRIGFFVHAALTRSQDDEEILPVY